jgi:uncharacterized protein YndB with AHSA1/START domain
MSGRTDRASRLVAATPAQLYAALLDPDALVAWLPPEGMTGHVEWFDARPGGGYRMVLSHPAGSGAGKTGDDDVVDVRFVDLEPDRRIVQEVDFVADDPASSGTMRMTWMLTPVAGGAEVEVRADDVPPGITAEDHAAGMSSSLAHLAAHVEA